jgi:hypothetical protein
MRRVFILALLASTARADDRVEEMIDHLNAGRTREALELATPEVIELIAVMDDLGRQAVHAMIAHNERYAGGKADRACRDVLELGRSVRKRALAWDRVESHITAAEILLLEGRTKRARDLPGWFDSWRAAAQELAAWQDGKRSRDRALVRAVQILAEGARWKGAPPAEELLEAARALVRKDPRGEAPESPAYLAYLLSVAEHDVEAHRKKDASEVLAPFDTLAASLGGRDDDLERATIFNQAVALSRREGLGLSAGFKTTREKAAHIEFDLPVSYLWSEPRDDWDEGAAIDVVAQDGRKLRGVLFEAYGKEEPWDAHTPAPANLRGLAELRIGAIVSFERTKISRKSGPRNGSFNHHLTKGLLTTIEGVDEHGRAVASRHFLFEDEHRAPAYFEVTTADYGDPPPDDPLFDEFVASVR